MLIAFLIALGVDIVVVFAFASIVIGRRRWLKGRPGLFAGAIRLASGELDGLDSKWIRGSGHWVREVLVWHKAPFLFRTGVVPIDGLAGERPARTGEVKRLGDKPIVLELVSDDAKIEVAVRPEHRHLVAEPAGRADRP